MKKAVTIVTIITFIIGALVLIWSVYAALYFNGSIPRNDIINCDYNSADRTYVKHVPNCPIDFECAPGTEGFKSPCGCGCKKIDNSTEGDKPEINDSSKNYCNPKSREGSACIALYKPVCGWFGQNIQCIKYPCASTYGNSCEACHNKDVEFWTEGECPK